MAVRVMLLLAFILVGYALAHVAALLGAVAEVLWHVAIFAK